MRYLCELRINDGKRFKNFAAMTWHVYIRGVKSYSLFVFFGFPLKLKSFWSIFNTSFTIKHPLMKQNSPEAVSRHLKWRHWCCYDNFEENSQKTKKILKWKQSFQLLPSLPDAGQSSRNQKRFRDLRWFIGSGATWKNVMQIQKMLVQVSLNLQITIILKIQTDI